MPATPKSSMFNAVDYANGTLTVTFKNGKKYDHKVPPDIYEAMVVSPSMGKYYNSDIKPKFPHSAA